MVYPDIEDGTMPPKSRDGCRAIGMQSIAFAPMLFEDRGIGTLWVGRPFRGLFKDKQLALLKTFAEQAVIAIQNARLFNETKEALDQQRASGEVLAAISSSIADTRRRCSNESCEAASGCSRASSVQIEPRRRATASCTWARTTGRGREAVDKLFPFRVDDTQLDRGLDHERAFGRRISRRRSR